jgi:hypothetical protein
MDQEVATATRGRVQLVYYKNTIAFFHTIFKPLIQLPTNQLRDFSPRANYTDWATAASSH